MMEGYTILSLLLCLSVASVFSNNAILNDPVPLGLESYVIPDSSLTASSEYNADHGAKRGRLNLARVGNLRGAWSARVNDAKQWIQVDLADIYRITSVATQGRQDVSQWVTSYKLACSTDGTTFYTVQGISAYPRAVRHIFTGNADRNTIVTNTLPVPQICRYVRLMPVSWSGHISLRMEIYGEGPFTVVRLVGSGSSANQGRVEVYANGQWGTVCDDLWDQEDANVVCRQLGFPGAIGYTKSQTFGAGSGPILMDNTRCVGDETSIMDCLTNGIGVHNCQHSEDVGVVCRVAQGISRGAEVRLAGSGSSANQGRVEVYINGQWGTVCDYLWGINDADVVCRQLGFPGASRVTRDAKTFGAGSGPVLLDSVRCEGDETSILDCMKSAIGFNSCLHSDDAGVICDIAERRSMEDMELYHNTQEQVAAEERSNAKKDADLKKKNVLQALSDFLAKLKDK